MSSSNKTGCIIAAVVGGVLVVVIAVVVLVAVGYYTFAHQAGPVSSGSPNGPSTAEPVSSGPVSSSSSDVEKPSPTSAEQAAIAGGKTINWGDQGMSWTVPPTWTELTVSKDLFSWKSPGSFDAGFINVAVSSIPTTVPADISLKAMYDAAIEQKRIKKYDEARWLEIDGIKGVEFLEAAPEDADDPRRLQWQAYRTYNGEQQLINIILSSNGKNFSKHTDALHAILYSSKISK